jgi:hypothetical protein
MASIKEYRRPQVADLDELVTYFTNKGVGPKVVHGLGTMLGFHPWLSDRIYWFAWDHHDAGFRHALSNRSFPEDATVLDFGDGREEDEEPVDPEQVTVPEGGDDEET